MNEHAEWASVAGMMDSALAGRSVTLGSYIGYWFARTPRRALYFASYYKFAANLIGSGKRVLDVGCSEGLGTWMLAIECGFARGIELDDEAIGVAKANWEGDERIEFACEDFLAVDLGKWDAITNFDVIEHIRPENAGDFLTSIASSLVHDGISVIGTPSKEGQRYASTVSRAGHVNVYSGEQLETAMREHFDHVFMFGANDEVVHTGFLPMAHYLIAVGCKPRRR